MLALMVLAIVLGGRRDVLARRDAVVLFAGYVVFVAVTLL
jgi:hypothetical protein